MNEGGESLETAQIHHWQQRMSIIMMTMVTTQRRGMENMLPMTITIMAVSEQGGVIHASVAVDVPDINARARINMHFPAPKNAGPEDWRKEAYDRALMVLDPA